MKFFALGPGADHPAAPADPNLRPWALATIKNTLNQPLFFAVSVSGAVMIKTDINFSCTAAAHPPGPLLQHWNRVKDRAGRPPAHPAPRSE